MRVCKYRRVSTDMQREEGVSLSTQDERLDAFIKSQGWTVVADYADEGFSAKNMDRPALQQLIKDIKKDKFDVVLVYRLDRLVRSVSDLHELLQIMDKHDVKFKSCTEVFDTTSATGRMFITIIATLAQWERETIAERVFDNMLARSEKGMRNGAPAPYGYIYKDGSLELVEEEAKWVKFIFDKYKTTGSQNIAKTLNKRGIRTKKGEVWSDFSIRYLLKNPIYAGYVRWNYRSLAKGKYTGDEVIQKINQDNFQVIISKEEFDEIQVLMKERSTFAFRSDNFYPYSGVAKCAKCGNSLTGAFKNKKSGGIYRFYKCSGRFRTGVCDSPVISEEAVDIALMKCLELPEFDLKYEEQNKIDREQLEKELVKIDLKKSRIKELYVDGDINKNEYKKRMDFLIDDEIRIQKKLEIEEIEATYEEVREWMGLIKESWNELSYETRKAAVRTIFSSLTVKIIKEPVLGRYPQLPILEITDYKLK
ncbi:recombinase family protein [Paenibacillus larvae]|uniref:recombinase family protein n=1 Tax=Paenibacillus larvae TaxID=1464 RepID=UPI0022830C5A|nr:recombinase family protein [Paenibacillus larvae]